MSAPVGKALDLKAVARKRVRMLATDFSFLDQHFPATYPRMIVRAEGAYVYDDTGLEILDTGLHWGANMVGHGRADVADAMADQAKQLEFATLYMGVSHAPVAELAERLAPLVPVDDPTFFFVSSGSEANELAFRIARAYHMTRGEPKRVKILSRAGGYHGSSLAAVTATGMPVFHDRLGVAAPAHIYTAQPSPGRCGFCSPDSGCNLGCAADVERTIVREDPATMAAFIAEPVGIQQAVKVPHADYWRVVAEICRKYGVLLIADEVISGFGRTGKFFASEHWELKPDILTIAKGITSGYVPMAATVVAPEIDELVVRNPLIHANTWAGHPVACAAALACLDITERENLIADTARKGALVDDRLNVLCKENQRVVRTAVTGLLASIEYSLPGDDGGRLAAQRVRHECYERGLFVRVGVSEQNVGFTTYYPPLVIDDAEIDRSVEILAEVLTNLE